MPSWGIFGKGRPYTENGMKLDSAFFAQLFAFFAVKSFLTAKFAKGARENVAFAPVYSISYSSGSRTGGVGSLFQHLHRLN